MACASARVEANHAHTDATFSELNIASPNLARAGENSPAPLRSAPAAERTVSETPARRNGVLWRRAAESARWREDGGRRRPALRQHRNLHLSTSQVVSSFPRHLRLGWRRLPRPARLGRTPMASALRPAQVADQPQRDSWRGTGDRARAKMRCSTRICRATPAPRTRRSAGVGGLMNPSRHTYILTNIIRYTRSAWGVY